MTTSDLIRGALAWLATYALHSTLFLGSAWVLSSTRRPRVNRNRERVWKLAVVGGILSASLQCALGARAPFGHVDWSAPTASTGERARPIADELAPERVARRTPEPAFPRPERPASVRSAEPAPITPAGITVDPAIRPVALPAPADLPVRAPHRPPTQLGPAPRTPERPLMTAALERGQAFRRSLGANWQDWILAAWCGAGLLGLAGFGLSWAALQRRLLGREFLSSGPEVELLARLTAKAGLKRRVRVSVSPRIRAPFSTGWLRPEICLPRAARNALTAAQLEALLAHELAHLVRRDPVWFALTYLCERLFFFQPLNRLARRRLSELAEVACDDWAVRWTGARLALASCLTEVAGWIVGERPHRCAAPGLAGSPSRLGRRVERLLDDRRSPAGEPPTPWWPPIAAAALAVAVLAVPGVSAQGPRRERPKPAVAADPATRPAPRGERESVEAPAPAADRPTAPAEDDAGGSDPEAQRTLEEELSLLEAELVALESELRERDPEGRFARALQELGARLEALRGQYARAQALLARLAPTEPPAGGSPAPAASLAPTVVPGETR
jgi:hypothetical protein